MKTSETISEFVKALSAAQGEFRNPERNREVNAGTYKFAYTTLDCVMDAVRGPLAANGLAIIQAAELQDGLLVVTTRIAHASGQWIESELAAKPVDLSAQKIGATITYLRRYSLCGLLGIASEEDSDGDHATVTQAKYKAKPAANPNANPKAPTDSSNYLNAELKVQELAGDDEKLAGLLAWVATAACTMSPSEKDRIGAKIVRARRALEGVADQSKRTEVSV